MPLPDEAPAPGTVACVRYRYLLAVLLLVPGVLLLRGAMLSPAHSTADCAAGDLDCVERVLVGDATEIDVVLDRLNSAGRVEPVAVRDLCAANGVRVGQDRFQGVDDILAIVGRTGDTDPVSEVCVPAIAHGLTLTWTAAGVSSEDLDRLVGRCVLAEDAKARLCGEMVAAAAADLHNPEALARCTGLSPESRRICFAALFDRFTDGEQIADRMDLLVALCAYWPLDWFQGECFAMVADPVFADGASLLEVGPTMDTGQVALLRDLVDFCDRVGPGRLDCQGVGLDVLLSTGRAGPTGSERRSATCDLFDSSLVERCRREGSSSGPSPEDD